MKTKKTGQTGKLRSGSEWIYGLNPVLEAIKAGRNIKNIYISSNRHHKVFELKKESEFRNIPLKISDPIFFNYTFNKGHQGVAAEVSSKDYVSLDELLNIPLRKNNF